MTDYTKTTDFAAKDSLPSGDANKVIRGTEFDTEFNNIATASATKADLSNPSFQGDVSVAGNITVSGTVDGRDVAADGTKLDTVETNADVTDTANVTAAGAVMDSELTNEAAVKALDQGVATTDSPTFAGATLGAVTYTATDGTDGQVLTTDGAGNATFEALPDSLYLNVKDFGATGDGTTDDTTSIQNAINHASNNDIQTIFFPAGHYKYTTLRLYHDATDNPNFQETPNRDGRFQLRGTGRLAITDLKNVGKSPSRIYGSILESTSSGSGLIVEPTGTFSGTDARNFVAKDLTLVADNTGYIVTAESCPGLTFDHCSFKQLNHQGSGILARNCWFFTMNQCYVFGQSWIDEAFATAGQTEFSYTFDNPASTSDIIVQKKGGLVSSSDYSINTTTKVVTLNTGADLNDKVTISRKNTGDGISSQFVGSAFGSFAGLWNITDSLVDSWANGVHWTGGAVTNLSLRNTAVQNCNNYNIYGDAGVIQQMLLDNVYMENQSVQGVSFIKGDGSGTSSATIRNLRMINCFFLAGATFPRVTGTCIDIDSIEVIDIEGMYVFRMRQPFLNITATKNLQNVPGEIKNSIFSTDQDLSAEPTIYLLSGKIPNVHNCVWPGFSDGFYDTTNDILLFDPSVESNFPRQYTDIKGTTGTAKFGFGDTKVVTGITSGPYNITGSDSRTYYDLTHSIAGGLKVILPDTGEVNDGRLIIIKNNEASTSSSQFPYINVVNNSDQNTTISRLSPGQAGLFILDQQNSTEFKYVGRTFTDDLELTDDHKITFGRGTGAGPDMEIYHDSASGESRVDTLVGLTLDGLTYPTADGTVNQVLTTDGSGTLSFANVSGIGINAVVDDTTPQLGGNLDLNSNNITGTGNLDFTGTINTVLSVDGTTEDVFITGATPGFELVESDNGGSRVRYAVNNSALFQSLYGADTSTFGSTTVQTRFSDGTSNQVIYTYDGGANDYHWWGTRGGGDRLVQIDSSGKFRVRGGDVSFFDDSVTSEAFFWDASTSRLGLGTTTPSSVLHARDTNSIVYSEGTGGYGAFYAVGSGTNAAYLFMGNAGGEKSRIQTENDGTIVFSNTTSATERLRISSTGDVGIGTGAPNAPLDVVTRDSDAIGFRLRGRSSDDLTLIQKTDNGATVQQGVIAINSSGNFGINTTLPARTLHINDTMRLEPRASAPSSPAAGDIYFDSTLSKLRCYDGTAWNNLF